MGRQPSGVILIDCGTMAASRARCRKTAHTGEPASRFWMNRLFRGLLVTAEQLRDDRIIEEAVAGRPDPLHLAAVFGFGPRTGLGYAAAAQDSTEPPIVISKVEHYTHKSGD
jgi:hypothetical protein